MLSHCYNYLLRALENLSTRLSTDAPELPPWLSVTPESIFMVLRTLELRLETKKSTKPTMSGHARQRFRANPLTPFSGIPGVVENLRSRVDISVAHELERIKYSFLRLTDNEVVQMDVVPPDVPRSASARKWVNDNIERIVDVAATAGHRSHYSLSRQLDTQGGDIVRRRIEGMGVRFLGGTFADGLVAAVGSLPALQVLVVSVLCYLVADPPCAAETFIRALDLDAFTRRLCGACPTLQTLGEQCTEFELYADRVGWVIPDPGDEISAEPRGTEYVAGEVISEGAVHDELRSE
ncbi:uncharacterized protein BXZ73DRAFT_105191 [Epithele typhae]|uniref:uncharacterized protein n=1 Tax=Epithele typhae TaxID=378194 RepID=UPI002007DB99|nr:uncharacterized protein BXZ73DRAFT_105191 [Epithele typhae]KAH9918559.1 hypothetical protein BXZ73DRAFT_105191 [Epithele typhae]